MKRLGVVYLDLPDSERAAKNWSDVDTLLAWDREADRIGAPQNVESLFRLFSIGLPVWYRGGMETVHTSELILGLGCEKVLVSKGFYKTERMPEHFVRRLGDACVPVVASKEDIAIAEAALAKWAYCSKPELYELAATNVQAICESEGTAGAWGVALLP